VSPVRNQVRVVRRELKITQQQLAERIGVTRQTISLIEKGAYNPSLKLCLAICHTLGKTLDEIFWLDAKEWAEIRDA